MVYLFAFLALLFAITTGVSLFYMFRFARLVMVIEDDFSEAVEDLEDLEELLGSILKMKLFFDSPDVQAAVQTVLDHVKQSRTTIGRLAQKFVERSKQKYVIEVQDEDPAKLAQLLREEKRKHQGASGQGEFTNEVQEAR